MHAPGPVSVVLSAGECGSASECLQGVLGRQLRSDGWCDIEFCVQGSPRPGYLFWLVLFLDTYPNQAGKPYPNLHSTICFLLSHVSAGLQQSAAAVTSSESCKACSKGTYSETTAVSACKEPWDTDR